MFKTLDSLDTEFSADSVEWCPIENYHDIFVCGMYFLKPDEDTDENNTSDNKGKIGRIYLLQIIEGGKIRKLQQLDVPAVFDMKWAQCYCYDKILLGVVNSNGCLQIFELYKTEEDRLNLKLLINHSVNDDKGDDVSALSLDWSTGNKENDASADVKISVSDSEGKISIFMLSQNGLGIEKIGTWIGHQYEAWITAFDYWNTNIFYSGGDDNKLLKFDMRSGKASILSCRCHKAGVTSLHSNKRKEYCLASGSYDEILRIWDTRNLRQEVSETTLSGGIWRLKWDPFYSKYLLAACMYGGFQIVAAQNLDFPKIVADYKEHESISYGADWSHLISQVINEKKLFSADDDCLIVGTCSFYDHLLKISAVSLGS